MGLENPLLGSLCEQDASVSPCVDLSRAARVSLQHGSWLCLSTRSQREQGGICSAFYVSLRKQITPSIPFLRSKPLSPATLKGTGVTPHLMNGAVSKNLWIYLNMTPPPTEGETRSVRTAMFKLDAILREVLLLRIVL